jgi:hypothetical protein
MWQAQTGAYLGKTSLGSLEEESLLLPGFNDTNKYMPTVIQPNIKSLLLYKNRLVVIVSGYREMVKMALDHTSTSPEYRATRVIIYDTKALATGGNLTLMYKKDINGEFSDARAVGTNMHVVTTMAIDYQDVFGSQYYRSSYESMTDDQYTAEVRRLAETESIPMFVKHLTEEIMVDGKLPNIARLSTMQTHWNPNQTDLFVYKNGVSSFYIQVSSFDISAPTLQTTDTGELAINATGAFLPSQPVDGARVYSAVDTMIIATQGYDYVPESKVYKEFTYLYALALNGANAETRAVGHVPGELLNSYALDVKDDILRVGHTVRDFSVATTNVATPPENTTTPRNYISMLRVPAFSASVPPGTMEIVGQVELGKKDKAFSSIRFFDNIVYAVTRLKRNPFYVVDLSQPTNPKVLGVSNVTGFSEYLHPMNDDNTLLLAIGQITDEVGYIVGMQITVLDARNPAKPAVAQRYSLELAQNHTMRYDAFMDFKAFRYDRQSGRLIVPIIDMALGELSSVFRGFYIFVVNENEITLTCKFQQADYPSYKNVCFLCRSFPFRSMIFNGNVTTTSGFFVRSTNMNTCAIEWNLTIVLPIPDPEFSCCTADY